MNFSSPSDTMAYLISALVPASASAAVTRMTYKRITHVSSCSEKESLCSYFPISIFVHFFPFSYSFFYSLFFFLFFVPLFVCLYISSSIPLCFSSIHFFPFLFPPFKFYFPSVLYYSLTSFLIFLPFAIFFLFLYLFCLTKLVNNDEHASFLTSFPICIPPVIFLFLSYLFCLMCKSFFPCSVFLTSTLFYFLLIFT